MHFDHPVNYGYVPVLDFEYDNLSGADGVGLVVGEEKKVATVERRLHAPTKINNNRRSIF